MRYGILALAVVLAACGDGNGTPPPIQPAVDTTPPVITLTGDNPQIIAVGEAYVELGATATDNRDGDLSAAIVINASAVDSSVPGEYPVTYDVSDTSGNAAVTVNRTVIYEDRTAPVITLQGDNPQVIVLGNPYIELGATATDNVDGDLTDSITINTDALELATVGDYEVTYDVSDTAGNAAESVTRMVSIRPPVPEKASVTVEGDIKTLTFSWEAVPYTDHYRLLENADGHSGFTQIGGDIPPDVLTASRDIAVHLFDWVEAQYLVEACNVTGCKTSDIFTVSDVMLDTIGYFKASNTDVRDGFGGVVLSADGKTLAVSVSSEDSCATGINDNQNDNSCENSGAVYVFRLSEDGWYQQAYIKASNSEANDRFGGYSNNAIDLSADGNTLAIGARGEDSCATGINGDQDDNSCESESWTGTGAVYLFRFADDEWYQEAYIKASNTDVGDQFQDVALSADGNTLAVGAGEEDSCATGIDGDQDDNSCEGAGAVYLYRRENEVWYQSTYIKASNTGFSQVGAYGFLVSGGFGQQIELNEYGDTLIVTAIVGLYVFRYEESTWREQVFLEWGYQPNRLSDIAVDAEGDMVAVSWIQEFFGGWVNLYRFEDNEWKYFPDIWRRPMTDPEIEYYLEPHSLAFSADGQWLAVGVILEYWDGPGFVDLLRADGQNWNRQVPSIFASNAEPFDPSDRFGGSVALSADGKTLAVSATGECSCAVGINGDQNDNSCYDSGAVYLY